MITTVMTTKTFAGVSTTDIYPTFNLKFHKQCKLGPYIFNSGLPSTGKNQL